ncbi:hypothetical protein GCM10007385_02170 [Tateyamaria omphalii]|uniref:Panacea domain-containing protein n=1 Tax=Tateyamaria omphalii TaxID=299262 RepID=UPI001673D634|nr:Panacea domain-containing protein [Tateyamaria omphalii]GGX38853.1 hypothetical protein GCM10007385_02170 [Tateyamaria omphalii]
MKFQVDRKKLELIVHTIIDECEPVELGQVKLHKCLYYADMLSYLNSGRPLTGATYKKRPFGPTCEQLLETVDRLVDSKKITCTSTNYYGYRKSEYTSLETPNSKALNANESQLISRTIQFVCRNHTASSISEFSHDIVWHSVEMGQHIDYALAINMIPVSDRPEHEIWADRAIQEIASERRPRKPSTLEGRTGGTLRARMASRN